MSRKSVFFGSLCVNFCIFVIAGNLFANPVKVEVDISQIAGLKYSFGHEDKNGKKELDFGALTSGFSLTVSEDDWSKSFPSESKVAIEAISPKKSWWVTVKMDQYDGQSISIPCNITSANYYPSQVLVYKNDLLFGWLECQSEYCSKIITLQSDGSPFSFSIQMTANGPLYYPVPSPSSIILVGSSLSLFLGFASLSIFRLGLKKRIL